MPRFDKTATPVEFANEDGFWLGRAAMYRLNEPIFGMGGEVASHIMTSTVTADADGPAEVYVFAVTEDGKPLRFEPLPGISVQAPPIAEVENTLDAAAVLADLGFEVIA